jgi:PAS domain S-box-containing protein
MRKKAQSPLEEAVGDPEQRVAPVAHGGPGAGPGVEYAVAALEAMAEGVVVLLAGGEIVSCNPAAEAILGLTRDQMTGRNALDPRWQAIHEDGSPFPGETHPVMVTLRTGERFRAVQTGVHRPDGTLRWISISSEPIPGPDGRPAAVVATFVDVTESRRAEHIRDAAYRISDAAGSAGSLDEFLRRAHEILGTLMPASNFYVALLDVEAGTLSFPYFVDEADPPPAPRPLRRGLTDYVIRSGEPLLCPPEVFADLEARGEVELVGTPSADWLGAPLKISGVTIGAVVLQIYAAGVRFKASDRDFLSFISNQLAMSIERKRAEAALQESAERHRAIVRTAMDGFWLADTQGSLLEVNEAYCRMSGYSEQELLSLHIFDLEAAETSDDTAARIQKIMAHGEDRFESRQRRKDGTVFDVEVSVQYRPSEGGLFVVFLQDITERKQAAEIFFARERASRLRAEIAALWTREEALPAVLEKCAQAMVTHLDAAFARIWTLNPEENVLKLQASAGMYTHLDGPHGRVPVGKFKIGLIAEERKPHVTNSVVGDPRVSDQEWARREGMRSFAGYPLLAEGRLVGVMAMFARRPLSEHTLDTLASLARTIATSVERRRAAEALRESEARFRGLFDNVAIGVYRTTPDGRVLMANPAIARMLGCASIEELQQRDLETEGYEPGYPRQLFKERLEGEGQIIGMESSWTKPDGTRLWVRESARVIRDAAGKVSYYEGTLEDTSERKRAEEELLALHAQLDERVRERTAELVEANRELEAYSYSISHELRTPLRAIDGHAALIVRDRHVTMDDEGRRHFTQVRWNAQRMGRLIDDLLAFSRAGRTDLTFRKVDMTAAAKEAFALLVPDPASPSQVSPSVNDLPEADGDPALLMRVWDNLLSNAVKFSAQRERPEIHVEGSVEGDENIYRVRDNGVGFDMQYVDKLFGVFHRLHGIHEFPGTGVGLALVRRIVLRHGGRVWAEGELGRGATLSFSLPRRG